MKPDRIVDERNGLTLYRRYGFLMVESDEGDRDYLDLIDCDSDLFCDTIKDWQKEYADEIESYND